MDPDIKTSIETAEEELGTGALDKAEKSLRDAIEKLKSSSWSPSLFSMSIALRLVKGLRQLSNGKEKGTIELAQEVLTQGLNKYPFEPKLLNEQAQLYCDTKKYDKAVESFENAILQESIDKDEKFAALVGKATALRHLRHFKKAEDTLQQALALDGASPKFLIEQGWLHFYGKRYAAAFSAFKKAFDASVEVDKHQARVAMLSARQALDITAPFDDTRSAKALMSQWFNNGVTVPQASRIYVDCSAVLEELNLYPAALNNVEQLLEIDEGNLKGWCLKISALKWLRRFGEAEKAYREAQARWPRSVEVWKEMSNLYYEEKRFRQAYLQDSGEAVKESPISESDKQALAATLEQDDEAKEWAIVSLRKMRQFSEAQIKVDEVLATQPNNVNFLCEKAFIYYSERHYDQAIEFFRRALQVSDYDKFARKWLIASLRKKAAAEVSGGAAPDFSEAKRELDEALTKLSYDTGIWEESAWLAFDEGNLEQALKDFDQAIDLDPYLIHKQFSKIEILARLNRWDEALNVFQTLEKKFPNDAEVDEQLCWFYLRLGEPQLAKEQWKKIKKYHPNNVLGFNAQGGYELAHRNYEAAEEAFRKAIAKVDYEPQYYINLGWALVRQIKSPGELANLDLPKREKLFQEAKNNCWKALELDPYSSKAYGCLGVIAYRRNAFRDAEFCFRKSIELNPADGSYVELAGLYCQLERYEDATKQLQEALRLNPHDARAYIETGNVSIWKGDIADAIAHCRQAIIVEPKNPEAHRALAIALMRAEKYEEAEATIRKALPILTPAQPWRLYLLLSQILVQRGDITNKDRKQKELDLYEEALRYVNDAKQGNSSNAEVFFHAGIAYYKLEDYGLSQKSFADSWKLNRDRYEAERYSRIVQTVLNQQKQLFKINTLFGYVLAGACIVILAALWFPFLINTYFLKPDFPISSTVITTLTPLLLGLLVVAAMLPGLNKLKLPGGFEAEISEPKSANSNISTGPRGDIGFGSSLPLVDPEPR